MRITNTLRVVLLCISVTGTPAALAAAPRTAKAPAADLLKASKVIAFVHTMTVMGPLQKIDPARTEILKGIFAPGDAAKHGISLRASPNAPYPTTFEGPGEYLVFLANPDKDGCWPVLAAFRVARSPRPSGSDGYLLPGFLEHGWDADRDSVALLIRHTLSDPKSYKPQFDKWLYAAKILAPDLIGHEKRVEWAKKAAAGISPGTTRADVEKVFVKQDFGLSGLGGTRYYVGAEVMVEVPYDRTGGNWKPENRVNGPLKVYRSVMHYD